MLQIRDLYFVKGATTANMRWFLKTIPNDELWWNPLGAEMLPTFDDKIGYDATIILSNYKRIKKSWKSKDVELFCNPNFSEHEGYIVSRKNSFSWYGMKIFCWLVGQRLQ